MHLPRATYRFQFNEHFRLAQALELVPYLHDLGISHVYASPLFRATPHSGHGYDVCDFNQLNPEIGTEADLENLASALHAKKMGLVLDIVPNHMGVGTRENQWWWDVLAKGEKSPYAAHFDIDWASPHKDLTGKVLVPVLGDHCEAILKKGELKVLRENDTFLLGYHEHRFPLAASTTARVPVDARALEKFNADPAAVGALLEQQHYRLAFHELGDARLNYRRFFAISTLAAVRVEDEKVFAATHALLRRWVEKGWLDGLRVDHPDGLRRPEEYLQRLRALAPEAWIVVEKILEPGEPLPDTWPVAGTTGYDFLNQVNGIFVDTHAEKPLTDFYAEFTGETTDYPALVREKKREVLETLLHAERERLTALLVKVVTGRKLGAKFSSASLRAALTQIIVCFPVYRSYIAEEKGLPSAADMAAIKYAVHLACDERPDISLELFGFIHSLFLERSRRGALREFVARFQQLTGSVMAKGVEDTAFYCFNRFTSLNEVGGDPSHFGVKLDAFHDLTRQRQKTWPRAQLASSTHDTKRAEDVRARLNLLSEIPELWTQTVTRWAAMNACHRQGDFPDRNAEYLYYQTLAGAWPLTVDRAQAYMEKAANEAKQHTTWTRRNAAYDKALQNFVAETLRDPEFTTDLEKFSARLATAGHVNSLAQTLVKLTAPGVPDIYQGCELTDGSLVDPDNRRPVDFALRRRLLNEVKSLAAAPVWERRAEGAAKLWMLHKVLKLRERQPGLFETGYEPRFARGARAEHVVAFLRAGRLLPIVPRFLLKLNNDWQNTSIILPPGTWADEFSGDLISGEILLASLFQKFPVALLVRKEKD